MNEVFGTETLSQIQEAVSHKFCLYVCFLTTKETAKKKKNVNR